MSRLGGYSSSNADVRVDTNSKELYYQTSSKRYKTNIVNLENSLDKINLLRPVRYKDINTKKPACGLIAEETVKVIPEVVFTKEIDASFLPAAIGDIGAAIIGPTVKGPALIPTVVTSYADCLLYTSPSPRDRTRSRMPSSA